ncbi:hypothetical protein [Oleiharenicola sp. Vm1]|uniref:hypothetical protein n=1 Tax=Oleiharenicola sp. Vm1 TaxID=3398393 RepID=UPI0039F48018
MKSFVLLLLAVVTLGVSGCMCIPSGGPSHDGHGATSPSTHVGHDHGSCALRSAPSAG